MAHGISPSELRQALDRWRQSNIITEEQATRILEMESAAAPAGPAFNPAQILTWLGGFLAIIASAVFIGVDWANMGGGQQTFWSAVGIAGLWGIAWLLRHNHDDQPRIQASNLLVIAGTGLIMVLGYAFFRLTGLWPEHSDAPESYRTTSTLMGIAQTVAAIVAVFWAFRLRVSWMLLPAGFVGWMAWISWMDLVRNSGEADSEIEPLRLALYGVLVVIAGFGVHRLGWKHHATMLFVVGLTINLVLMGIASFAEPTDLNGIIFLAMTLVAIALGIVGEFRIFLVYGAIGLYTWLSALVIETFGGSRPVAFALILVGVAIVALGALWQRYHLPDGVAHSH